MVTQRRSISLPRLAYTIQEVAAAFGISYQAVYKEVSCGRLKTGRFGKKLVISPIEIVRYCRENGLDEVPLIVTAATESPPDLPAVSTVETEVVSLES